MHRLLASVLVMSSAALAHADDGTAHADGGVNVTSHSRAPRSGKSVNGTPHGPATASGGGSAGANGGVTVTPHGPGHHHGGHHGSGGVVVVAPPVIVVPPPVVVAPPPVVMPPPVVVVSPPPVVTAAVVVDVDVSSSSSSSSPSSSSATVESYVQVGSSSGWYGGGSSSGIDPLATSHWEASAAMLVATNVGMDEPSLGLSLGRQFGSLRLSLDYMRYQRDLGLVTAGSVRASRLGITARYRVSMNLDDAGLGLYVEAGAGREARVYEAQMTESATTALVGAGFEFLMGDRKSAGFDVGIRGIVDADDQLVGLVQVGMLFGSR